MKIILTVCVFIFLGCGTSKSKMTSNGADSLGTTSSDTAKSEKPKDSTTEKIIYGGFRKTPACVKDMIAKFQGEPITNPPRKIFSYTYNREIVFYVPAICCDFFSDLYDMDCNLIAHPDGGITGRGDGSATDFIKTRKDEKLVWEDQREK